jgi:hypothetical protein
MWSHITCKHAINRFINEHGMIIGQHECSGSSFKKDNSEHIASTWN